MRLLETYRKTVAKFVAVATREVQSALHEAYLVRHRRVQQDLISSGYEGIMRFPNGTWANIKPGERDFLLLKLGELPPNHRTQINTVGVASLPQVVSLNDLETALDAHSVTLIELPRSGDSLVFSFQGNDGRTTQVRFDDFQAFMDWHDRYGVIDSLAPEAQALAPAIEPGAE